jgi:acyl-CoA thioesterase-1
MRTNKKSQGMTYLHNAKRILVVALLIGVTACGGSATDTTAVKPVVGSSVAEVKPGTWVVMGSSTAAGTGAPADKGWAALLQVAYRASGAQILNIAKGGMVTYEGLGANSPRVSGRPAPDPAVNIDQALSRKPVLLIVSYPTNDTARGYSVDETVRNVLEIRAQALAAGVPVIVTSTQPRNLADVQLAQMRMIDQRLAASIGDCLVDVRQPIAGPDGRLAAQYDSGDGVHPSEAGHQLIASTIEKMIGERKCVSLVK